MCVCMYGITWADLDRPIERKEEKFALQASGRCPVKPADAVKRIMSPDIRIRQQMHARKEPGFLPIAVLTTRLASKHRERAARLTAKMRRYRTLQKRDCLASYSL